MIKKVALNSAQKTKTKKQFNMPHKYNSLIALFITSVVFLFAFGANAAPNRAPEIQIIDYETQKVEQSWLAFDQDYQGGLEVIAADLGGDGQQEIVVVQSGGDDARAIVKVFRADGSLIREVPIFAPSIIEQQVDIAAGDVDGDGKDEIVASFPNSNSSMVYIFDDKIKFDSATIGAFEAFGGAEHGVGVAVGDVGTAVGDEIIVTTGPGTEPLVRIFNQNGAVLAPDIVPFSEETQFGVTAATINTSGGLYDNLVVGLMNGGETWIKSYNIDSEFSYPVTAEKQIWTRQFKSGVNIDGLDIDGDGTQEIAVSPAGDQRAEIITVRGDGADIEQESIFVYEEDFRGGVHFAVANLDTDNSAEIIVSPRQQTAHADPERPRKYIEVNLAEQIEYIWEDGYLRNVYLISSGLPGTPSPPGEHSVLKKIAVHTYDGRPVYFFPGTKWNLRYKAGSTGHNYYLHTAYWHNNFGHPMSHGCINMREEDAEFVYHWAEIGDLIWIH